MALRALRAWRSCQDGRVVGVGRAELLPPLLCRGMCINQDTGGDCEGFIEEHLTKGLGDGLTAGNVVTVRREALALYRNILRSSRLFMFRNEKGDLWRDVLREAARKEFEVGRLESDPTVVTKLIVSGKDFMDEAVTKYMAKREKLQAEEDDAAARGVLPAWRRKDDD